MRPYATTEHPAPRRGGNRGGFTVMELIVVMVVVAILGTLSVPTFRAVTRRSEDRKAHLTMASAMALVAAQAAARSDGVFAPEDFTTSGSAATLEVGVSAAGAAPAVEFTTAASTAYGMVSYALPGGATTTAGLAMRSVTGRCQYGTLRSNSAERLSELAPEGARCTGTAAGEALAGWAAPAAPTGTMPAQEEDTVAIATFAATWGALVEIAPGPAGPWGPEVVIAGLGTLRVGGALPDPTVTMVPLANAYGPYSFALRSVSAAGDPSALAAVTGAVDPRNDAPLASPTLSATVVGAGSVDVAVTMAGSDPADAGRPGYTGETVAAYQVLTVPASGTLRLDADPGPLTAWTPATPGALTSNPELRFTPKPNTTGTFVAEYRVADLGYPSPSLWSAPATASWSFSIPVGDPAASPEGAFASTLEETTVSVLFSAGSPHFEISAAAGGPFSTATLVQPAVSTVQVSTEGQQAGTALVTFTPAPGFAGPASFWIRASQPGGEPSAPTLVTVDVACDPARRHSFASFCAPGSGLSLLAGRLSLENNTVVRGNVSVAGPTTMSNFARMDVDVSGAGRGHLRSGALTVTGGSGVYVAENVTLTGDLVNDSPQTVLAGNVALFSGSVRANQLLTVGGNLTLNAPGTVSGTTAVRGTTSTGPGLVASPGPVALPSLDLSGIGFDATFATWAQFHTWAATNSGALGRPGRATVRITDPTAGALDLAGNLDGHLLVVTTGPTTISSWPSARPGSSISVVSTSTSTSTAAPALTVGATGDSPSAASVTIYSPGLVRFAQRSAFYGQVLGGAVQVSQKTDIIGRSTAYWAGRVLFVP